MPVPERKTHQPGRNRCSSPYLFASLFRQLFRQRFLHVVGHRPLARRRPVTIVDSARFGDRRRLASILPVGARAVLDQAHQCVGVVHNGHVQEQVQQRAFAWRPVVRRRAASVPLRARVPLRVVSIEHHRLLQPLLAERQQNADGWRAECADRVDQRRPAGGVLGHQRAATQLEQARQPVRVLARDIREAGRVEKRTAVDDGRSAVGVLVRQRQHVVKTAHKQRRQRLRLVFGDARIQIARKPAVPQNVVSFAKLQQTTRNKTTNPKTKHTTE